jgi:hypothetical protein
MCAHHHGPVYMEQRYYDSLSFSLHYQIWTDDNYNNAYKSPMQSDTCFKIAGNMWYQYSCLKNWRFDTLNNSSDTSITFDVTLGHDMVWNNISITLTATPHGGTPPYFYIFYDEDNHDSIVRGPDTNRNYLATYPSRFSVLAVDSIDSSAYDYVSVYSDTCYPASIASIPKPDPEFKIYPNPSHGVFTINIIHDYGREMDLYVYDIMGEEIKSEELTENTTLINLSNQLNGVYFCRITDLNGKLFKSSKIMIIHQ